MRWTTDVAILLAVVTGDSALQAVFGATMKLFKGQQGERAFVVPSLEYEADERPEAEVFTRINLRFFPYVRTEAQLETTHDRLYALFHRDTEWTTGGLRVYESQAVLAQLPGMRDGISQGPIEFTFKVVRQRYN